MNSTANDQVPWSQWIALPAIMTLILAGLEFLVYRSLAAAQRGEDAAVWAPIAIVYDLGGFAAAMSVIPILWLLLMGIVAWQTWLRVKAGSKGTPSA